MSLTQHTCRVLNDALTAKPTNFALGAAFGMHLLISAYERLYFANSVPSYSISINGTSRGVYVQFGFVQHALCVQYLPVVPSYGV